jgi:hypothetical protein
MPKSFDFLIMVVTPEKIAHVSRRWQGRSSGHFKAHLAVTSTGHGVFKGWMKCRKIPGEGEEGKGRRVVEACQTTAMVDARVGIRAYATATRARRDGKVVDLWLYSFPKKVLIDQFLRFQGGIWCLVELL